MALGGKAQVAATWRKFQVEMGISLGFLPRKTLGAEEGIVERIDEQGRYGDAG